MGSIYVENLGKAYKQYHNKFSRLFEWLSPFRVQNHQLNWVLKDLTFKVNKGEVVGVIGKNGAGKSTLLKIITGTTKQTSGTISINGRLAAILELGMGFHPDFTGRQNAILAAQLLGLDSDEIEKALPDIEEFANIGHYFDLPVRVYSSGMQARVAFSVATSTNPDILIVDEALSVGDIAFQAKCMLRMQQLSENGVTILFVTHALAQVRQFCQKALFLADGKIKSFGDVDKVCDEYQNYLVQNEKLPNLERHSYQLSKQEWQTGYHEDADLRINSVGNPAGNLNVEFTAFDILIADSLQHSSSIPAGADVVFRASIKANVPTPIGTAVGLLICDKSGYPLAACNSNYYDKYLPSLSAGEQIVISWRFKMPFYAGDYRVDIGMKAHPLATEFYDRVFCAKVFSVATPLALQEKNFSSLMYIDASINIVKINSYKSNEA